MVIRCEQCSTLYELDEALLSPAGSQVQCTKCDAIFTAFPPRSPGRTLVGVPAAPAEDARAKSPASASAGAATPAAGPAPAPVAPHAGAGTVDGPGAAASQVGPAGQAARAGGARARSGPAPVYRPPGPAAAASPPVTRGPVLRRDPVGSFEARLRWSARARWILPAAVLLVVAAVVGAVLLLRGRGDAGIERDHAAALALLAADDDASLDAAVSRLEDLSRGGAKRRAIAADRELAEVLRGSALAEDVEALGVRLAARIEDRERLRRERPAGWEGQEQQATTEIAALEPDVRSRAERSRALLAEAHERLKALQAEAGDTPEVARALGVYHAAAGDRDRARRTVRTARERGLRDPFIDLAEGWADAREAERGARERALTRLVAVSAARPDLLRARHLLARVEASLGRQADALATATAVVAANGKHGRARRLRDELAAAAKAVPAEVAPQPAPPPPPPPAPRPRRAAPPAASTSPGAEPAQSSSASAGAGGPAQGSAGGSGGLGAGAGAAGAVDGGVQEGLAPGASGDGANAAAKSPESAPPAPPAPEAPRPAPEAPRRQLRIQPAPDPVGGG